MRGRMAHFIIITEFVYLLASELNIVTVSSQVSFVTALYMYLVYHIQVLWLTS